ncbi:MAG: glycosyltransferase [Verrucomicrobiota bacterium]
MKISIIIPAYNEEKLLPATLTAVKEAWSAFEAQGWQPELIVCDNNSTDQTAEVARAQGAHVVFEPNNQIARARNSGARAANGDWLVFVDADSHPSRELFAEVAREIQQGRAVGGGAVVQMDGQVLPPIVRLANALWNGISRWKRYAAGSFIYCETAAFRELGGFSEDLYVTEEIEFSQRLKRLAKKRGKQVVILTRHPLLTSARKLHLYSRGEYFRFLWRSVFSGGRQFRNRDQCHIWYDGRR